jgi:hypothetical protein
MDLRCLRCGKPLTKFAVSIPTSAGPAGWGPRCAQTVVVKPTRRLDRQPRVEYRQRAPERDPRQMQLECFA